MNCKEDRGPLLNPLRVSNFSFHLISFLKLRFTAIAINGGAGHKKDSSR